MERSQKDDKEQKAEPTMPGAEPENKEAAEDPMEAIRRANEQDKQKIIASGRSEVVSLTPEERAKWVEAMRPVWTKFEKDIGKENIEAAVAANGGS